MTIKEIKKDSFTGQATDEQVKSIGNLSKCTYAEDLMKVDIKKNAPIGATHYLTIMFLGLVYIKYINDHPYYLDNWDKVWTRCNSNFEAKPL